MTFDPNDIPDQSFSPPSLAMSSTMTATTLVTSESQSPPIRISHTFNGEKATTSSLKTLQSLYNRATRAFVQRQFLLTYSLLESGFALLPPPMLPMRDPLSGFRRKWDVLRITLEATMYNASASQQAQNGYSEDTLPPYLKELLFLAPPIFATTLHTHSLQLFTPTTFSQSPSSTFLPSQVLLTLMLMTMKIQCPDIGRAITEDWLARRGQIDLAFPVEEEGDGYLKVLETYCLDILPRLEEWDYAGEFLKFNDELDADRKKRMIEYLHDMRRAAYSRPISPSRTPTPQSVRKDKANGSASSSRLDSSPASPTRSPSPSPSTSSFSTTSTHTVVPSTSRPAADNRSNGAMTPLSRASTVTPLARVRDEGGVQQQPATSSPQMQTLSSYPRAPAAPPIEEGEVRGTMNTRPPKLVTLIRDTLLPHLPSGKLTFILLAVLFPLLSILYKVRSRRRTRGGRLLGFGSSSAAAASSSVISSALSSARMGNVPKDAAEAARRRLESIRGTPGNLIGNLWTEVRHAITDAVLMAGKGLI